MRSPIPDTPKTASLVTASHLVVLQHGLLGSKHDFDRFVQLFRTHLEADGSGVYCHAAASNASSFFKTYDGIDHGGERLADEIQGLATQMPHLQKLSLIGHSLGGLYCRYCIGVLFSRGFFDKIEPMNFVTMAAPHLGSRRPRRGATNAVFNALMPKMFSRTGTQLTLTDAATTETQALSCASRALQDKHFYPALLDLSGSLLVHFPDAGKQLDDAQKTFELFDCVLSDRKLRISEGQEKSAEGKAKLDIDMSCADVKIVLPSGKSVGNDAPSSSRFTVWGQNEPIEKLNESGNFDIQICWSANETEQADADVCVLRIPEADIHRDWKWLVALSNAAFGVRCLTLTDSTKEGTRQVSETSPLLSCLTRGQFMQALQMFKARTLYSNIFFDLQVPYTCAAVRAFNPYRASAEKCSMSPVYKHIASVSLESARQLRDTIPHAIKCLIVKKMTPDGAALASPPSAENLPHDDHDVDGGDVDGANSSRSGEGMAERKSLAASSGSGRQRQPFFSRHRGKTVGSALADDSCGARPAPFLDGDVILDQLPFAFTADTERDELRGMLLSMQSVGWRRIDVLFGSIMSHEHIIAKRANLDKPLDSGADVVHHVMDTLLL